MPTKDKIYETWNEIAEAMGGYSAIHARRLFVELLDRGSSFPKQLKYWLGPGRRIKMVHSEIEAFKKAASSFKS